MKFSGATSLLVAATAATVGVVNGAGVGTFFTYFENGGLGPSNWQFLNMDENQCGGTSGKSGFGQSPVTISSTTTQRCDTDMSAYSFKGGDCTWDDLDFSISNNGTFLRADE